MGEAQNQFPLKSGNDPFWIRSGTPLGGSLAGRKEKSVAAAAVGYQSVSIGVDAQYFALLSEAPETAAEHLAGRLESLLDLARLPRTLGHCGVETKDIAQLADEAVRQLTAQFNPRPVTAADFQHLYTAALTPLNKGHRKV